VKYNTNKAPVLLLSFQKHTKKNMDLDPHVFKTRDLDPDPHKMDAVLSQVSFRLTHLTTVNKVWVGIKFLVRF